MPPRGERVSDAAKSAAKNWDRDIPVWLLDIDGVLNAIASKPPPNSWTRPTDWLTTTADCAGDTWPILAARPVLQFVEAVHRAGKADIRWHTTWQQEAAESFAPAVGLPAFPLAPAMEFGSAARAGSFRRAELRWWKLGAAERVVRDERRRLVWTDDDLSRESDDGSLDRVNTAGVAVSLVSPRQTQGLTAKHLRAIATFLNATHLLPAQAQQG